MKLIRFTLPTDYTTRLEDCLTQNDIDFLQLDFSRCSEQTKPTSSIFAGDFRSYWRDIHKALYLSPTLQVVTNAGGDHVVALMEALAEFLAEHGSADMPIAAIRGSNLINSLEQFVPPDLINKDHNVLAAQVEIGAGPIATSLAEGARIVVCGDYDPTAPFLAAGVSEGFCTWEDIRQLGHLAAASQFSEVVAETFSERTIRIESTANSQLSFVQKLGRVRHADLACDYSHLELTPSRGGVTISNVEVESHSGAWNLRLTVDRGYQLESLISTHGDHHAQLSQFCEQEISSEKFSLKSYASTDGSDPHEYLEKLSFRGANLAECQQVLSAIEFFLSGNGWGAIVGPRPTIAMIQETQWHPIPRDETTLAVESRPAREWL